MSVVLQATVLTARRGRLRPAGIELDSPELVAAVRAGDSEAISRVLEFCMSSLRGVVRGRFNVPPELSEDILQEVRIAFWRAAPRFRGECSLRTYLMQITCRKCVDYLREKSRRGADIANLEEDSVDVADADPGDAIVDRTAIEQGMAGLPCLQREVLQRYYCEQKSYREIAEEMKIPIGSVGGLKAEALSSLRGQLSGESATDREDDTTAQ